MKKKTTKKTAKKSKDHLFKKGNKLGQGRPKTSPEMKAARKLTREAFENISHKYLFLPVDQLREMVDSKRQNMEGMVVIEGMIARLMRDSIKAGNVQTVIFFLERLVSKSRIERISNVVPTNSEMVSETMKTAQIEIVRLQKKSKTDGLSADETRSLVQLSKVVTEMVEQAGKITGTNDPRNLSDAELIKQAKEAEKVIVGNLHNETKH